MNKTGFMRIVEATIAVVIILGALILLAYQRAPSIQGNSDALINSFLDEIAQNLTLRGEIILDSDRNLSKEIIAESLELKVKNPSFDYAVEICDLNLPCPLENWPDTEGDIFAYERVISSSVKQEAFSPKKIKLFLWKKQN